METRKQPRSEGDPNIQNEGNRLTVAREKGVGRLGEKGEGTKKYKLVVTEQSWGRKVQHRAYSQ